ncbi:MAG: UV-damage endonuclease [Caeruleum heppii]|nr:MAG: UV-damage endonuclease [Caeruleum heppii]
MAKRKRSTAADITSVPKETPVPLPPGFEIPVEEPTKQGRPRRQAKPAHVSSNPNTNHNIIDGPEALRASPDGSDSSLSDLPGLETPIKPKAASARKKTASKTTGDETKPTKVAAKKTTDGQEVVDPEADGDDVEDNIEEIQEAAARPPPVHSNYLPLPWKGRLGYACLCTYLRYCNPPVFTSRTCRIASIIEQRHPLRDPSQPHHPTKNRPDRDQPASIERGQAYVEGLGLANAKDIVKMLRWNDRFGIRFFRLSSEMFPFASHDVYGYKLAPFASEVLAETGRVAAELGHRLTTHPGQFTQLGSPRKEVIRAAIRDLEYHTELLSLLKLPPQQNRDAVMILHMGGVFGDKAATLDRFRENYQALSQDIKDRLVLENDDVSWSVHDLLPICEELNIPLVLDYHHHNIIFDSTQLREGTQDIMALYPRIRATWTRKNITQKMHYSEPTPAAITGRQRRKHNPRVATLPPCPDDMDLMIEAKDKEQAVFELMRTFKLPGYEKLGDLIPHVRIDENKPEKKAPVKKASPKKRKKVKKEEDDEDLAAAEDEGDVPEPPIPRPAIIPDEEIGMGGPDGRVYWPPGMEEWLRPVKRVVKKKDGDEGAVAGSAKKTKKPKGKTAADPTNGAKEEDALVNGDIAKKTSTKQTTKKATPAKTPNGTSKPKTKGATKRTPKKASTPSVTSSSELIDDDLEEDAMDVDTDAEEAKIAKLNGGAAVNGAKGGRPTATLGRRRSGRAGKVDYKEGE